MATFQGGPGADTFVGTTGDDFVLLGGGRDVFRFGAGDATVYGGTGRDMVSLTGVTAASSFMNMEDTPLLSSILGDTRLYGVEQVFGSAGNDTLIASARAASTFWGADGDDTLYAADADFTFVGGAGKNQLALLNVENGGTVDLEAGQAQLASGAVGRLREVTDLIGSFANDTLLGSAGNDFILGYLGADYIDGRDGDDSVIAGSEASTVYGGRGRDTVIGGSTADTLFGGDGDDLLAANGINAVMYGGGGNDTVYQNANGSLQDLIDSEGHPSAAPIYGGDGDDTIEANSFANLIAYGDAGHDTLTGDTGQDSLYGGTGDDSLYGGDSADHLYGGDGADLYFGGDGDDRIFLGQGDDTVFGGEGYDRVWLAPTDGPRVTAPDGQGAGIVRTFDNITAEHISGTADSDILTITADIAVTGGAAGDDFLIGDAADNTLLGGRGDDWLSGGAGNDTYGIDSQNDVIVEDAFSAGGGIDTIWAFTSITIPQNVEVVRLRGTQDLSVWGNDAPQTLKGNFGSNTLFGGGGDDRLLTNFAPDSIESSNNLVFGGDGNDQIYSHRDDDKLYGGAGDDLLTSLRGSNTFIGGTGQDRIEIGSEWNDMSEIVFQSVADSAAGAGDVIDSFVRANTGLLNYWTEGREPFNQVGQLGDTIDLRQIDANRWTAQDDAFVYIGQDRFSAGGRDGAGQLRWEVTQNAVTLVQADVNGDGIADFEITLTNMHTRDNEPTAGLTQNDFFL